MRRFCYHAQYRVSVAHIRRCRNLLKRTGRLVCWRYANIMQPIYHDAIDKDKNKLTRDFIYSIFSRYDVKGILIIL